MASSYTGSLDTSANSHPPGFTFSTAHPFMTTSFSDLLASSDHDQLISTTTNTDNNHHRRGGGGGGGSGRIGSGVPKFKSVQPPSLPLSSSPVSPFSYFAIPPGLSPAELLDSPVLLDSSNIFPSPTTGSFPFNWKSNSGNNNQQNVKQEDKVNSDFTFHQPKFQSTAQQQQPWSFQEPAKQEDFGSGGKGFSPEIGAIQTNNQSNNNSFQSDHGNSQQQYQSVREQRKSDDGYNWRKYGQKQVKGSENPRSYYKCTYPNCPTKKKVERSLDGQITEIVYKGSHNHPKPQSTRRSSSSSSVVQNHSIHVPNPTTTTNDFQDQSSYASHGSGQMDSVATPENSSISVGDDDFDSQKTKSGADDFDEDEPEAKRWKREGENEGISAPGSRTVREPRVVVQTTSDIDILDDGYRWRKYGQKVVKGNPNPRSYYKCTHPACPVRKHVERASHDLRAVITTYEGKHNHDVPAARGSGHRTVPEHNNNNNNNITMSSNGYNTNTNTAATATRPVAVNHQSYNSITNPLRNVRQTSENQGGFGFSGYANPMGSYMNQSTENLFSRTKEEPRDDMFIESLLC